jgi:hypothetical protein
MGVLIVLIIIGALIGPYFAYKRGTVTRFNYHYAQAGLGG